MSNYPAGVSDSHPYFNPPREIATGVECGADEALVIPSFAVKAALTEMKHMVSQLREDERIGGATRDLMNGKITWLQERIDEWEQEREYECPFHDEIDLPESECAQWVCPVCGNDRETDTLPEERDPDEGWDRRGDD